MHRNPEKSHADFALPKVMGILNVTPDSFSDGGRFQSVDEAVDCAGAMLKAGADIIDVGGESTRPGSLGTPEREELRRVVPVIEGIVARFDVSVSIDTSKPRVMRAAITAGATMINDVFALRRDGAIQLAAESDSLVCLMHMQGEPGHMQESPSYQDLPGDVIKFLAGRVDACIGGGIKRERLIVDPGFGFGKNDQQNLKILANLEQFAKLDLPLLVGLSRKQMLGNLTGKPVGERCGASIAAAIVAVQKGAKIVRTHDVSATVDALAVLSAIDRSGK